MSRRVVCFWTGGELSWLERLSAASHLRHGHPVTLYHLGEVTEAPEGVDLARAEEILPPPFLLEGGARQPVAVYSDLLRLELLARAPVIWCDMDAITVAPLGEEPILAGHGPKRVLSGVLALPQESPALRWMRDFCNAPCPVPPWKPGFRRGRDWTIRDLPWGSSGPKALDHALRLTGEIEAVLPQEVFYPLFGETLGRLNAPRPLAGRIGTPASRSVHVFGAQRIWMALTQEGLPRKGSWLDAAARAHGIRPEDHPIEARPWMAETAAGRAAN